jgi:hypothetical protein
MADDPVIFTCPTCGTKGNPPSCGHFAQAWTTDEIAEAHRRLIDADVLTTATPRGRDANVNGQS